MTNTNLWVVLLTVRVEADLDTCFWCASSDVHTDRMFTEKCPVCQNKKIELLTNIQQRMYRFDYDLRREIMLEFTQFPVDL